MEPRVDEFWVGNTLFTTSIANTDHSNTKNDNKDQTQKWVKVCFFIELVYSDFISCPEYTQKARLYYLFLVLLSWVFL